MALALNENEIVEQLKDAGNRLLNSPSSQDELLRSMEELEQNHVDEATKKSVAKVSLSDAAAKPVTPKTKKRTFPHEGQEGLSKKSMTCPRGRPKKSSTGTKVGRPKKNASNKKDKNVMTDEPAEKALERKGDQIEEDEVFETPFGKMKYKEDIVGCRLKVWWPIDKKFYEGRVVSYNKLNKKHRIDYNDGDVEFLKLVKERFEFIGSEIADCKSQDGEVKPQLDDEIEMN